MSTAETSAETPQAAQQSLWPMSHLVLLKDQKKMLDRQSRMQQNHAAQHGLDQPVAGNGAIGSDEMDILANGPVTVHYAAAPKDTTNETKSTSTGVDVKQAAEDAVSRLLRSQPVPLEQTGKPNTSPAPPGLNAWAKAAIVGALVASSGMGGAGLAAWLVAQKNQAPAPVINKMDPSNFELRFAPQPEKAK